MFVTRMNEGRGLSVCLFTGRTNSDDDYRRYLEVVRDYDRRGQLTQRPVMIQVVDPGNSPPGAEWRKRIAEAGAQVRSNPLFCMVSESPVVRGAVWIIRKIVRQPYEVHIEKRFEDAVAWAESERGEPLPELHALLAECRTEAERAAGTGRGEG
jgi:hypothetical protein